MSIRARVIGIVARFRDYARSVQQSRCDLADSVSPGNIIPPDRPENRAPVRAVEGHGTLDQAVGERLRKSGRALGRAALPPLVGIVLAGLIGGAAFAAMQLLPRPAGTVTFVNRLAESISSLDAVRSIERVGSRRLTTSCRRITGQRYLLTISPHRRFVIDGSTLTPIEARWHRGQALAVEVGLAGCPSLLTALVERLVLPAFESSMRLPVYVGRSGHAHVIRVSLTSSLELVVDRRSLAPVAMRFALARLGAASVLLVGAPKP